MKRFFLVTLLFLIASPAIYSQNSNEEKGGYHFTPIKELKITPVKNQARSSTCWSFSALSFLESELLRSGKGEYDLSEMFIVSNAYFDKGDKFIRTDGFINFSPGSSFGDVLSVWRDYGIVPEEVMPGINYGEPMHIHGEMDAALKGFINALVRNPNKKFTPAWKVAYRGILDAYLGEIPENFSYKGREYTPKSFAQELALDMDDYISLTSFTHHPFYKSFAIEVADNWRWEHSYNLPIDELMEVFENAIMSGYTIMWGSDVSELGFSRKGIAIVPETEVANMTGSDQERWTGVSKSEIASKMFSFEEIVPEMKITQELRQEGYDNGTTTDDHGMHIYGIAKDQKGNRYYMVKNSWGETGDYKGHWYASESFVKYKTMNIVVHKNALPKEIRKKLGIK